jgi:hypothetical protein
MNGFFNVLTNDSHIPENQNESNPIPYKFDIFDY